LRAVVFANGRLRDTQARKIHTTLHPDDIVIAADGGAHHCLSLGVRPRYVIGDLDSLDRDELSQLKSQGSEIFQHPRRKDYTDLELALRHAQELGVDEILVLGALGDRWDQTIANILLPAILSPVSRQNATRKPPRICFLEGEQELFFLRGGDRLEIRGQPGDIVSLIPIADCALGVTTQNLEYALEADDLLLGSTLGISNVLLGKKGSVSLNEGFLLCVVIHQESQ
jgi:thiamine pyrophosphokinase